MTARLRVQVRVPTHIVSTICDDRGEEPTYNGVTMSELIEGDYGVGDVIALLWFKRKLPKYATKFMEMCLMLCADHGPCVSGAHNAIVTARAGKVRGAGCKRGESTDALLGSVKRVLRGRDAAALVRVCKRDSSTGALLGRCESRRGRRGSTLGDCRAGGMRSTGGYCTGGGNCDLNVHLWFMQEF